MLIPCLQESDLVVLDQVFDLVEFATMKAVVGGQGNRIEPELGFIPPQP